MYLIDSKSASELSVFLKEKQFLDENESVISLEKPGEGNMNYVLRLITNQRSFILKQSREFVQKYPQIPAPIERLLVEAKFYEAIADDRFLSNQMPKLLGVFPEHFMLLIEDLGANSDYSSIYKPNSEISESEISTLIAYLNKLHGLKVTDYPSNTELKQLNHFHIFKFPFDANSNFDLDAIHEGLQPIADKYKSDSELFQIISELGEIYLTSGESLIHGDFYPGSWLKTASGIKIIDPEFGYLGKAEFDLGVFIAHLKMAKKSEFIELIATQSQNNNDLNINLMYAFAGVEVMRRLMGVAQLPLSLNLFEKNELLDWAYQQVKKY